MAIKFITKADDFLYWAKQTNWTIPEAAALFVSIAPDTYKHAIISKNDWDGLPTIENELKKKLPHDTVAKKYFQISDSLKRDANEPEQTGLSEKNTPMQYVQWAENKGFDIPKALVNAISKQHNGKKSRVLHPEYTTSYLMLMNQAIIELKLSDKNQPPKKKLEDWFEEKDPNLSNNLVSAMATLIRLPDMQKGGYYRADKTKGDTQKTRKPPKKSKG